MTINVTQTSVADSTRQRLAQDAAPVEEAKLALRSSGPARELFALAKRLKRLQRFDFACTHVVRSLVPRVWQPVRSFRYRRDEALPTVRTAAIPRSRRLMQRTWERSERSD